MNIFFKTIFPFAAVFSIALAFFSFEGLADEFDCCYIETKEKSVHVIVYQEEDGMKRDVIWRGQLKEGEKKKIPCRGENIRYDYTTDLDQPWEGDVSSSCINKETIIIP